jgi:hypothetical protein
MVEKQSTIQPTKLSKTGVIEMPKFDCSPFRGKPSKIGLIEEVTTPYGFGVRVSSEVITTFNGKEVRASKLFSLSRNNQTGEVGWTKESKLAKLLLTFKVAHYQDLMGKAIVLTSRADTKTGMEFLDFA